jgi:hypothetical protein
VLLAHRSADEITRILDHTTMRRLTATTITDPEALREELSTVRRTGVAYDQGEAISEVHCVAAPVRDAMGLVIAAVSITVPESRFVRSRAEFTQAVKTAVAEISKRMASAEDAPLRAPLDDPSAVSPVMRLRARSSSPTGIKPRSDGSRASVGLERQ